ncbi:hypothetical protein [Tomitella cavernea]|uniref:Uncharacterized protein n=1 Tax=Tomitella cavernea TaxID=1387982 RepID=A0ABP9C310_9ACTN|nr:hypothetical protein [Tomitella cavernea]
MTTPTITREQASARRPDGIDQTLGVVIAIILAFIFLIGLEVFLGLALLNNDVSWLGKAVGRLALASALPIYYLAYERLMRTVEERGHAD